MGFMGGAYGVRLPYPAYSENPRKHWESCLFLAVSGIFYCINTKRFCAEIVIFAMKLYQNCTNLYQGLGEMGCDLLIHFGLLICEGTFVDSVHDVC